MTRIKSEKQENLEAKIKKLEQRSPRTHKQTVEINELRGIIHTIEKAREWRGLIQHYDGNNNAVMRNQTEFQYKEWVGNLSKSTAAYIAADAECD